MKTLLVAIVLSASLASSSYTETQPQPGIMEPVVEKGERKATSEEVTANIENERKKYRKENIDLSVLSEAEERDIYCLTEAIYFESLGEPKDGKVAVATVIMNRAKWEPTNDNNKHHYEFSKSICDVVAFNISRSFKQRKGKGRHAQMIHRKVTTCAFSYRCERGFHNKLARAQKRAVWHEIKALATETYVSYNNGTIKDPSEGATFYHADFVRPWWRKSYERTTQIGAHIFYRIK